MKNNVMNLLKDQKEHRNIEWVEGRYYDDKSMSTKEGHAQKHLILQQDESKKWQTYNKIDINVPFDKLVEQYERVSIDNVYNNINRSYWDDNNHSINVCDRNNLETCLKYSKSKNKLVVTTCFYRTYFRNIINNLKNLNIYDVAAVNVMTLNEILNNVDNDQILSNYKKSFDEMYGALKENQTFEIRQLIDNFKNNNQYDNSKLDSDITKLLKDVDRYIEYIRITVAKYNLHLENYKHGKYMDYYNQTKNGLELDELSFDELEKENLNVIELDYYETLEYFKLLLIYYMYLVCSKKETMVEEYFKRAYVFKQLDSIWSNIYNDINKLELLARVKKLHNGNFYTDDIVYYDYMTVDEILGLKFDLNEIDKEIAKKDDEYHKDGFTVAKYCNDCGQITYTHYLKHHGNNQQLVDENICPNCHSKNLETIRSTMDKFSVN